MTELDKWGRRNRFQDPTRGTILNVATATGETAITDSIQHDFLQNLSGPESILGRSVTIYSVVGDVLTSLDCCVI